MTQKHTASTKQQNIRSKYIKQNQRTNVMNAINTYLSNYHVKLRRLIKAIQK